MTPDASPFWQNAFLIWVIVCIGWSMFTGWRSGVVRVALSLVGVVAGYFVALTVAAMIPGMIGGIVPVPGAMVGAFCGLAAGLVTYFLVWLLGALLFKRTAQQKTGVLRFFYGLGGALLGAVFGVFIFWGVLLFVRALGGFFDARFEPMAASSPLPPPNVAITALVKLKNSIEAGENGKMLVAMDPMPATFYRVMDKLGRVSVDPAALTRLTQYPEIAAVISDPAISGSPPAPDGKPLDLAEVNRRVTAAMSDPSLIAKVQKIDIEKALDYALQKPAPANP